MKAGQRIIYKGVVIERTIYATMKWMAPALFWGDQTWECAHFRTLAEAKRFIDRR